MVSVHWICVTSLMLLSCVLCHSAIIEANVYVNPDEHWLRRVTRWTGATGADLEQEGNGKSLSFPTAVNVALWESVLLVQSRLSISTHPFSWHLLQFSCFMNCCVNHFMDGSPCLFTTKDTFYFSIHSASATDSSLLQLLILWTQSCLCDI